ncbi:50S ribosomal protein L32 [Candidatus Roizmanbacteria bacterium CG_4_10_14_3_um_filter_39_13]|uniref:Large ribosomal subunit protein bL32 n=3 Tax=Candidatus Roizmaniibacteriota TaxID=1752723 RepID=A0A2H0KKE0_9BACT|nr:MAG: 50S ribosomal protein L32 [Candidatus Roizmanbacteria bacterium CG11_big_fil_rev_8_21_14_0_20_37_16]PIV08623.1 MAG: 50S ribosomal protein L32 [Candidatus Roizmanbacteria bacterium CG03_land_8_20_14_0_80_39_12]PIX68852.1 MAG: 50S ribosomal protein L32 [Candidatus Roizmanbacteria bacterium CG_4_10_14_3_um_filter_39_13]
MTPLPKRKHSTQRVGKRNASHDVKLASLIVCKNCGKNKLPHRICKYCNK